jgi:hypothetical protein
MANRLAGVAFITVNGASYEVVGDCTWSSYTVTRETLKSLSDPAPGFREVPQAPFIEITTRDASDTPLSTFQNMTSATVVLELANSKTVNGQNMWVVEALSVNEDQATFKLRFEGQVVTESLS